MISESKLISVQKKTFLRNQKQADRWHSRNIIGFHLFKAVSEWNANHLWQTAKENFTAKHKQKILLTNGTMAETNGTMAQTNGT